MIEFLVIALMFFFLGRFTAGTKDLKPLEEAIGKGRKPKSKIVKRPSAKELEGRHNKTKKAEEEAWDESLKGKIHES